MQASFSGSTRENSTSARSTVVEISIGIEFSPVPAIYRRGSVVQKQNVGLGAERAPEAKESGDERPRLRAS